MSANIKEEARRLIDTLPTIRRGKSYVSNLRQGDNRAGLADSEAGRVTALRCSKRIWITR